MPKQCSGRIVRPVCAPKVEPNEPAWPSRVPTTTVEALSRPRPPCSSATSVASNPSSPALLTSRRASVQSLVSSRSWLGRISLLTNSSAVWSIRWCSSVNRSGVKTVPTGVSSRSQIPPVAVGVVVAVLVMAHPREIRIVVRRCRRRPYRHRHTC